MGVAESDGSLEAECMVYTRNLNIEERNRVLDEIRSFETGSMTALPHGDGYLFNVYFGFLVVKDAPNFIA